MKSMLKTVAAVAFCGILLSPTLEAQTRGRGTSNAKSSVSSTHSSTSKPAAKQPAARPGSSGFGNASPNQSFQNSARPGNQGTASRPNAQPGSSSRPGNSGLGNTPGGSGNSQSSRPGAAPGGPSGANRPGYAPSPGGGHGPSMAPPPPGGHGPSMPPPPPGGFGGWHRPTPPPSWRPPVAWRPFNSILGLALGTTLNMSINALINSGYVASQYGANSIYVSNVPMLNLMWPSAVLYYNAAGGLCGSRFVYRSGFDDMTRYNSVYMALLNTYGAPYSIQNTISGIVANWWGTDNQFITLSYGPQYTSAASVAYYTTLSFGN